MDHNVTFAEEVKYVNNYYIMEYGLIMSMLVSVIIAYCVLYRYIAAASSRYYSEPSLVMPLLNP
jgi:hypothetical protein